MGVCQEKSANLNAGFVTRERDQTATVIPASSIITRYASIGVVQFFSFCIAIYHPIDLASCHL